MKSILVKERGGVDVLTFTDIPKPKIETDEIGDRHALTLLIQGLTAYLLLNYVAKVRSGESVLVHAAAGGVGNLLVQIAKLMNAGDVLGTAGTTQKRSQIKTWGVDHGIDYNNLNWHEDVLKITDGRGVDIILDPVGGSAISQNLSCLGVEGRFVNYGWLSGDYPSLTAEQCQKLLFKNQSVSGFAVNVVMERHPDLVESAFKQLFDWVLQDKLKPVLGRVFPLSDAAKAHQAILERKTIGKTILTL